MGPSQEGPELTTTLRLQIKAGSCMRAPPPLPTCLALRARGFPRAGGFVTPWLLQLSPWQDHLSRRRPPLQTDADPEPRGEKQWRPSSSSWRPSSWGRGRRPRLLGCLEAAGCRRGRRAGPSPRLRSLPVQTWRFRRQHHRGKRGLLPRSRLVRLAEEARGICHQRHGSCHQRCPRCRCCRRAPSASASCTALLAPRSAAGRGAGAGGR